MKLFARRPTLKAAAVAATITLTFAFGASSLAGATTGNGNATGQQVSDPNQTPSGSNGVNHNDTPESPNPDCTDSAGTSGTCSSAQPLSNADQNNTGANDTSSSNNYASTRNGADSDNGSGNGNATGQPCAGCVGKADNKNPHGQAPNGPTDSNNGYECDGNNGIGQTNPAHTSCTGDGLAPASPTQPVCDESSTNANSSSSECVEDHEHQNISHDNEDSENNGSEDGENASANTFAGFGSLPSEVLGETLTAGATPVASPASPDGGRGLAGFSEAASPAQPAAVLGETTSAGGASVLGETLARTGLDVPSFVALASVLVGAGVLLTLSNRRRRLHNAS